MVLFRPFNPRKWLILSFAALMAGFLAGGGFNFSSNNFDKREEKEKQEKTTRLYQTGSSHLGKQQKTNCGKDILLCALKDSGVVSSSDAPHQAENPFYKDFVGQILKIKKPVLISIIVVVVLVLMGFSILMAWLSSRFAFVFLEDVVKNDASIKLPFRENKGLGKSLFLFSVVFMLIFWVLFAGFVLMLLKSLGGLGVFNKTITAGFKQIFWTLLPFGLTFIFLILIAGIVSFVVRHFITVIMFRDKISITRAWPKFLAMLMPHKQDFITYLFIAMGLGILTSIISMLLYLSAFFGLLFPAGILTLVFYLIHLVIPQTLQTVYFIVIAVIFFPIGLFILYSLMCLNLPFAVFSRTLSVKFVAALDQNYNLFRYKEPR